MVSYLGLKRAKKTVEGEDASKDKDAKKKPKGAKKESDEPSPLWLFLTKKHRGRIRSSCMLFVSRFLQHVPKEVGASHIEQLAPLMLEMVAEDNSIVQGTLWKDAYPTLGK